MSIFNFKRTNINTEIVPYKNTKLSKFKGYISSLGKPLFKKTQDKNLIGNNFTLADLTKTKTGIKNIPNEEEIARLRLLVENVLDPLVKLYGGKIKINSAFRCKAVNIAVGSKSKTSQHMFGEAADITCNDNKKLYNLILNNLDFDQLINESDFSWIHVSYTKRKKNRKQVLKM